MENISILIPTYNHECYQLAEQLASQAAALGICYEVIVADDGSTRQDIIASNRRINGIAHARYIERPENVGRAAIRNFLACVACYDWLLFCDSDLAICRDDFVRKYSEEAGSPLVYGGISIGGAIRSNLRACYEKTCEDAHSVAARRKKPYRDFRTTNFMVARDIMLRCPFDERIRHYGYEDVMFGKLMEQQQIEITHIDNPLLLDEFEENAEFILKTEESLHTLCFLRDELRGYSRLLDRATCLPAWPILVWHRLLGSWERRNLTGSHPHLWLLNPYKLGFLVSLLHDKNCGRSG